MNNNTSRFRGRAWWWEAASAPASAASARTPNAIHLARGMGNRRSRGGFETATRASGCREDVRRHAAGRGRASADAWMQNNASCTAPCMGPGEWHLGSKSSAMTHISYII
eukprot:352561-Chlamydomonas_euryale.AAC.10